MSMIVTSRVIYFLQCVQTPTFCLHKYSCAQRFINTQEFKMIRLCQTSVQSSVRSTFRIERHCYFYLEGSITSTTSQMVFFSPFYQCRQTDGLNNKSRRDRQTDRDEVKMIPLFRIGVTRTYSTYVDVRLKCRLLK